MNTVEIIKDVIEKSDTFKTIRLNKKTNKIEKYGRTGKE